MSHSDRLQCKLKALCPAVAFSSEPKAALPEAQLLLELAGEVLLEPTGGSGLLLIDGMALPVIYAATDPHTPRVPSWMAELKLLWQFSPSHLAEQQRSQFHLPEGLVPNEAESQAIDLANLKQTCEFGLPPRGLRLSQHQDCSLLPLAQLLRCYEAARIRLWADASSKAATLAAAEVAQLIVPGLGCLDSILCLHRAGLTLLPVSRLAELLPALPWSLLVANGLGVVATPAEVAAAELKTFNERLLPLDSLAFMLPGCRLGACGDDATEVFHKEPKLQYQLHYQHQQQQQQQQQQQLDENRCSGQRKRHCAASTEDSPPHKLQRRASSFQEAFHCALLQVENFVATLEPGRQPLQKL